MSDAWSDIQEIKSKTSNLKAKRAARKKELEGLAAELNKSSSSPTVPVSKSSPAVPDGKDICSVY